jgi:hypothetical protein
MKTRLYTIAVLMALGSLLVIAGYRCSSTSNTTDSGQIETIRTNIGGQGISIRIDFLKGESHNHPLMAIWLEDADGKYIETIYVAESIGKGIFEHGDLSDGKWHEGAVRRPAALPYWGYKRGVKAPDGYYLPTPEQPMPDAVTGPTPAGNFILESKSTVPTPGRFKVMLEINQSWDWNEFWTNSKYQGDVNYMTSSQPSLVYEAVIDLNSAVREYGMKPAGHGHYAGADGSLDPDLSTLTTAMGIAGSVKVTIE